MLRDTLVRFPGYGTWDCDEINPIWRHGNLSHQNDVFTPDMVTPRISDFIHREFRKIAIQQNIQHVVEKTCANSLRVPFIYEILPEAKFIFIYRDGRDTVVSAAKRWNAAFDLSYTLKKLRYVPTSDLPYYAIRFGGNRLRQWLSGQQQLGFWGLHLPDMQGLLRQHSLYEICALQWEAAVTHSLRGLEEVSEERVYRVRYETFVKHPVPELISIARFLGVSLSEAQAKNLSAGVSDRSVGNYKKELSPAEQQAIEELIAPTLERLGYPTGKISNPN